MKRIVLFGDGLLVGFINGGRSTILTDYIVSELSEMGFPGYHVEELGKSKETAEKGLERLDMALDAKGSFVVLSYGSNEALDPESSLEEYEKNLQQILSAFDAEKLIVLTPGYIDTKRLPEGNNERQQLFAQKVTELAHSKGANVIDLYHHMTVYPEPEEFIQPDGRHPSEEGYHFLGALIARDIKEKLLAQEK